LLRCHHLPDTLSRRQLPRHPSWCHFQRVGRAPVHGRDVRVDSILPLAKNGAALVRSAPLPPHASPYPLAAGCEVALSRQWFFRTLCITTSAGPAQLTESNDSGNALYDNNLLDGGGDLANRVYPFISFFELSARFSTSQSTVESAWEELRRLYGWMAARDPGTTFWEGIGANGVPYERGFTSMAHGCQYTHFRLAFTSLAEIHNLEMFQKELQSPASALYRSTKDMLHIELLTRGS